MYWENNRILDQIDLTKCESQLHLHSAMAVESSINTFVLNVFQLQLDYNNMP